MAKTSRPTWTGKGDGKYDLPRTRPEYHMEWHERWEWQQDRWYWNSSRGRYEMLKAGNYWVPKRPPAP